jgi:membrane associated rhomboid family serine protease
MFIPIGDNIDRRTFPLVTVLLIVANAMVFIIQLRTSYDAVTAAETRQGAFAPVSRPEAFAVARAQWQTIPRYEGGLPEWHLKIRNSLPHKVLWTEKASLA